MDNQLLLIIPAYNEDKNITKVVDNLTAYYPQYHYVIINDGSGDHTSSICRENDYTIIDLPINLGLGGAFQTGAKYALENGYHYMMQFDADGQHLPEYIAPMLQEASKGSDIVIGSRYLDADRGFSLRRMGSVIIKAAIRLTTGKKVTDPTSGMRMFDQRLIEQFAKNTNYDPEPDTIAYLIRKGYTIKEVQVEMHDRANGKSYLTFKNAISYMLRMTLSITCIQWFRK